MNQHKREVLLFLAIFVLAGGMSLAQNASLSGTITDQQGGVVPGAEVTLVNPATGTQRLSVTDDQGRYIFAQVTPGTYEIRAALTGFKTQVTTGVDLLVDTAKKLDLQLELGAGFGSHHGVQHLGSYSEYRGCIDWEHLQ